MKIMGHRKFFSMVLLGSSVLFTTASYAADTADAIKDRTQPIGQVTLADAASGAAASSGAASAVSLHDQAKTTYDTKCVICHKDGVAGAPKFGSAQEWKVRLDATNEKDADKQLDALVATSIKGKNAMPPKGTCTDCTPEQLRATIQYMISDGKEPADKK